MRAWAEGDHLVQGRSRQLRRRTAAEICEMQTLALKLLRRRRAVGAIEELRREAREGIRLMC